MVSEKPIKTVNSLSGGKTSSYLAANYPADLNIFSLVCLDGHNGNSHYKQFYKDHGIVQKVNDKLQKYSSRWPEFVGTAEDPKTIMAMLDLEQHIGSEIIWLRGVGFETMLNHLKYLPNQTKRICTSLTKIQPIFEFLYMYHELPVKMRIGYRYDELERAEKYRTTFKFSPNCEYRPKSAKWVHRWNEVAYSQGEFPLIDDKITHFDVEHYWKDKGIDFPLDSNCQFCFWKDPQQLRKNFDTNRPIMLTMALHEDMKGHTLKKEMSLLDIMNIGLQLDFNFGTGSGCQAGFCTD